MTGFYCIEANIHRGFLDAVGPADQGWATQPNAALCQVEAVPSTNMILRASDSGYRTMATDLPGVVAYPPTITDTISVDVAANLDPTQTNVAASWGVLKLANVDRTYDSLVSGWQSDGQPITIFRGDKTLDATRGVFVDPPYASLVPIFQGVMGPWLPEPELVSVVLRDPSYYLENQYPRTLYSGTGGAEGNASLQGTLKPIVLGGYAAPHIIANTAPLLVDPANLVYQYGDANSIVTAAYDGGIPLTFSGYVNGVYVATPPTAGHFNADSSTGLLRTGSTPVFVLTADVANGGTATGRLSEIVLTVLSQKLKIPFSLIGNVLSTDIDCYCADPAVATAAMALRAGLTLATGDDVDSATFLSRLVSTAGALLVPGRDGQLRLLVLAAVPALATPVVAFDNTNIVSINRVDLPASLNPPPFRMRLTYARNWTVQASNTLGGGITAVQRTFVSTSGRVVVAVAAAPLTAWAKPNDPVILGQAGGSIDAVPAPVQTVVNNMMALWGVPRRLYEITVPQSVGSTLDWASIVSVTSSFDFLDAGKLGQIVGWSLSTAQSTSMFRVLV